MKIIVKFTFGITCKDILGQFHLEFLYLHILIFIAFALNFIQKSEFFLLAITLSIYHFQNFILERRNLSLQITNLKSVSRYLSWLYILFFQLFLTKEKTSFNLSFSIKSRFYFSSLKFLSNSSYSFSFSNFISFLNRSIANSFKDCNYWWSCLVFTSILGLFKELLL